MGNKPWLPSELELLKELACEGRNDVEIAAEIDKWFPRRTPTSCYFQARQLGLEVEWTTRPLALTSGGRQNLRPGNDERGEDIWHGAETVNEAFVAAMAREGRAPQEPQKRPGTSCPRTLGPHREGRPSSSSGWVVG
jgi:hypothetical protein